MIVRIFCCSCFKHPQKTQNKASETVTNYVKVSPAPSKDSKQPEEKQQNLSSIESMLSPRKISVSGADVPLIHAGESKDERNYASDWRLNGRRIVPIGKTHQACSETITSTHVSVSGSITTRYPFSYIHQTPFGIPSAPSHPLVYSLPYQSSVPYTVQTLPGIVDSPDSSSLPRVNKPKEVTVEDRHKHFNEFLGLKLNSNNSARGQEQEKKVKIKRIDKEVVNRALVQGPPSLWPVTNSVPQLSSSAPVTPRKDMENKGEDTLHRPQKSKITITDERGQNNTWSQSKMAKKINLNSPHYLQTSKTPLGFQQQ